MRDCAIVIVFFLLVATNSFAKKGFSEGYIITQDGDTLHGIVKDRDSEPFVSIYQKIRFVEKGKRGRKKYRASQIAGYKCGNREYRSVRLRETSEFFKFRYYTDRSGELIFLRLIKDAGDLIYYEYEFMYDDNNFVDSFPLFHIPGSNEMVRVTQGILGLKKKRLSEYFSDCKELVDAVNADKLESADDVFEFYLENCSQLSL